jgi:polyadenylate-binding protein
MQVTSDDLKAVFGCVGPITSAFVQCDASGNSRGYGFVNFARPDDVDRAMQQFDNVTHALGTWMVSSVP